MRAVLHTTPIVIITQCPLNDGNYRLTMHHTLNIGVIKCSKNNSITLKHKTYLRWIGGLNWQLWYCFWYQWLVEFPITVPVIGMGSKVTRAHLLYKRDYSTQGICKMIKAAAMEKMMPFPSKIHTLMLKYPNRPWDSLMLQTQRSTFQKEQFSRQEEIEKFRPNRLVGAGGFELPQNVAYFTTNKAYQFSGERSFVTNLMLYLMDCPIFDPDLVNV